MKIEEGKVVYVKWEKSDAT